MSDQTLFAKKVLNEAEGLKRWGTKHWHKTREKLFIFIWIIHWSFLIVKMKAENILIWIIGCKNLECHSSKGISMTKDKWPPNSKRKFDMNRLQSLCNDLFWWVPLSTFQILNLFPSLWANTLILLDKFLIFIYFDICRYFKVFPYKNRISMKHVTPFLIS